MAPRSIVWTLQQGRNAIKKHLLQANETVEPDEGIIIRQLLDESSKQANADINKGLRRSSEDAWRWLEKEMGWDNTFYQANAWSQKAKIERDKLFAEMKNRMNLTNYD